MSSLRTIATWTRWNYWRYFAVWILSIVEKRLHKIVPNAIDIIVTPTIALLIVGLLTIFIFMPLAGFVSDSLVSVVNGIISIGGVFSGFIIEQASYR